MTATARFSPDASAIPLAQTISGIIANDLAFVEVALVGLEPTDQIVQASFTAKVNKTDSDASPTTVQVVYGAADFANATVTPIGISGTKYLLSFPLTQAETQTLETQHGYDVRVWVLSADGVTRNRTVQSGTILATVGWTSLASDNPESAAIALASFAAVVAAGAASFNGIGGPVSVSALAVQGAMIVAGVVAAKDPNVLAAAGFGCYWKYSAGDPIANLGGTFTRASTATYYDINGILQTASSNVLRDGHYIGGVRYTLTEPSRTNLLLQSSNFSLSWSLVDITVGATITAPDNTNTAALLTAGSAGTDAVSQSVTATPNVTYALSFFAKRSTNDWLFMRMGDATNQVQGWFNLATGLVGNVNNGGTSTGAKSSMTPVANGFFLCTLTGAVNNGDTTISINGFCVTANGALTRVNNSARYQWGMQFEDNTAAPTSYIPTTTATVTRAVDNLAFTVPNCIGLPQVGTFYISAIEQGTIFLTSTARVFHIGKIDNSDPRFLLGGTGSGLYTAQYHTAAAVVSTATDASGITVGMGLEWRAYIDPTGRAGLGESRNGAAEVVAALGTAVTLDAAYNAAAVLDIGQIGGGSATISAIATIKAFSGNPTLAQCRAA